MEMTVVLERVDGHKFRASTTSPVALTSEGESRDEAIESLQRLARERLTVAELVHVPLPNTPASNPWVAHAGMWRDHPDFEAYLRNVHEYRRSADAEKPEA